MVARPIAVVAPIVDVDAAESRRQRRLDEAGPAPRLVVVVQVRVHAAGAGHARCLVGHGAAAGRASDVAALVEPQALVADAAAARESVVAGLGRVVHRPLVAVVVARGRDDETAMSAHVAGDRGRDRERQRRPGADPRQARAGSHPPN